MIAVDILYYFILFFYFIVFLACRTCFFAAEKPIGPEKCPVYVKLPWIGNVSSKFENQISKAIASCYYAVKPRVVYNTRVMLPSAKKDCVPTTQKSCVVYEFSCRCEARYVGRATQTSRQNKTACPREHQEEK